MHDLHILCHLRVFGISHKKEQDAQSAWFVKVLEFEKSLNLGETETGKTGVKYIRPAV